ncbi:MAG: hypothetical protein CL908_24535 [Deltaproteobacteria bacterium]|nr:hypothetical protein [Deltaproteobacteria bacterium]
MEIVDPRGRVERVGTGLAPRITRPVGGLRLGFLVNEQTRNQGPDFYGYTLAIEAALRGRFELAEVVRVCKPVLSRPAEPPQLEELRYVQGVVNGLAK